MLNEVEAAEQTLRIKELEQCLSEAEPGTEKYEILEKILEGERDILAGRVVSHEEAMRKLEKYK